MAVLKPNKVEFSGQKGTMTIPNFKDDWTINSITVAPKGSYTVVSRANNTLVLELTGGTQQSRSSGYTDTSSYTTGASFSCYALGGGYSYSHETVNGDVKTCYFTKWVDTTTYFYSYEVTINYSFPILNGKISQQVPGSIVSFGGENVIIVNPQTGYLLKYDTLTSRAYSSSANIFFDPTKTQSAAYYLNTTYYDSFPEEAKRFIRSMPWGVGGLSDAQAGRSTTKPTITLDAMRDEENKTTVEAHIGMLSPSEWRRFSTHTSNAGTAGILPAPPALEYLIAPRTGSTNLAWQIMTTGLMDYVTFTTSRAIRPAFYVDPDLNILNSTVVFNNPPTIALNTPNNQTLYENDTYLIDGTAKDTDIGNVVIVRYQINSGTTVAIETKVSDGTTPIPFSRQFTFKAGKLHYNDVAITGALAEGTAHKLKVWADDDHDGKSEVIERTFYVVPNRAPSLTVDPFESLADLIDADRVAMSGDSFDPDGNDVIVRYRINNGINTEIYNGPAGPWSFDFPLSKLKNGENTIVVEVVDTYDFKSSKTVVLSKDKNLTPLAASTMRYSITPPAGTAKSIALWILRHPDNPVTVEISMTNGTEPEQFVPMEFDSSGPDGDYIQDLFKYESPDPVEHIAIKLSWTGDKPILQVTGALFS